eukprot:PhM_4_TR4318/c0_g1_i1/m.77819/K14685/SLC40A1, FPN1; solute carrier family 40 (iron-regulated transporter), member 1
MYSPSHAKLEEDDGAQQQHQDQQQQQRAVPRRPSDISIAMPPEDQGASSPEKDGAEQKKKRKKAKSRQRRVSDIEPEIRHGFAGLNNSQLLCALYSFAAWGDRTWEFASVVLLLSVLPNTLFPASLIGIVEVCAAIIAMPRVGQLVDSWNRLNTIRTSIVAQNIAIFIGGIIFCVGLNDAQSWSISGLWGFMLSLMPCAIVAKLANGLNKVAIHKDWIIIVAACAPQCGSPRSTSELLTVLNAQMRRVDLLCSIVGPLVFGVMSSVLSPLAAAIYMVVWSAVSTGIEWGVSQYVYNAVPRLHRHTEKLVAVDSPADPNPAKGVGDALSRFVHHRVLLLSVSYSILYVSVLSFGGIMISYMKAQLDVADVWLAVARGLGAALGVAATVVVPKLIGRFGLHKSGLQMIWLQILCLAPIPIAILVAPNNALIAVLYLCLAISRFGLWGFDLSQTQQMQLAVEPSEVGVINGVQESMCNLGYLLGFTLTLLCPDPAWFAVPVWFSFAAVCIGGVLYTVYYARNSVAEAVSGDGHEVSEKREAPKTGKEGFERL